MVAKLSLSAWLVGQILHVVTLSAQCTVSALLRSREVAIDIFRLHCTFGTEVTVRAGSHVVDRAEAIISQELRLVITDVTSWALLYKSLTIGSCLGTDKALRTVFLVYEPNIRTVLAFIAGQTMISTWVCHISADSTFAWLEHLWLIVGTVSACRAY